MTQSRERQTSAPPCWDCSRSQLVLRPERINWCKKSRGTRGRGLSPAAEGPSSFASAGARRDGSGVTGAQQSWDTPLVRGRAGGRRGGTSFCPARPPGSEEALVPRAMRQGTWKSHPLGARSSAPGGASAAASSPPSSEKFQPDAVWRPSNVHRLSPVPSLPQHRRDLMYVCMFA